MAYATDEKELYTELDKFIDDMADKDGVLIKTLHHAQKLFGCLPKDVQLYVAHKLSIPAAKVYGVVTFYSYFTMEKKGKHNISVCLGTACFVRGGEQVLKSLEKELGINANEITRDGMYSLDQIRCVGACGLAPVVTIDDRVYGRVKPEDIQSIIGEFSGGKSNE